MPDEIAKPIEFRKNIMALQGALKQAVSEGALDVPNYPLVHYFTPVDDRYGCAIYARELQVPQGHVIIGKIHKYWHINLLMKGKVTVSTEFGREQIEAPRIWVSQPGTKRAVYHETDVIWVTIHLTQSPGEANLLEIEDELIAQTYEEIGLLTDEGEPQ